MSLSAAFSDDRAAQVVLAVLGRGGEHAKPLSAIAEYLGWTRRAVEHSVNRLRLSGWPVCSDGRGVWLGDVKDVDATLRSLHARMQKQYQTMIALQETARRMRAADAQQLSWTDAA